jgi:hypothetical protein
MKVGIRADLIDKCVVLRHIRVKAADGVCNMSIKHNLLQVLKMPDITTVLAGTLLLKIILEPISFLPATFITSHEEKVKYTHEPTFNPVNYRTLPCMPVHDSSREQPSY